MVSVLINVMISRSCQVANHDDISATNERPDAPGIDPEVCYGAAGRDSNSDNLLSMYAHFRPQKASHKLDCVVRVKARVVSYRLSRRYDDLTGYFFSRLFISIVLRSGMVK